MSNETSRVEAAALVIDPAPWRSEHPASLARRNVIRDTATAALAAADADDHANGIRRVRVEGSTAGVLNEVSEERVRQESKWGEQNHPNGTGPEYVCWPAVASASNTYENLANRAKTSTDTAAEHGGLTYADIFLEEVFEAMAESDPAKLRAELIQCAAVAAAWVEKIDRDAATDGADG